MHIIRDMPERCLVNTRQAAKKIVDLIQDNKEEPVQDKVEMVVDGRMYHITGVEAKHVKAYLLGADQLSRENHEEQPVEEKPVILVTEDGHKVEKGVFITLYHTGPPNWEAGRYSGQPMSEKDLFEDRKYFIQKDNMQEYIEYHKPCLSQKEIMENVLPQELIMTSPLAENIKKVLDTYVIEKLNNKQ